MSARKCIGDLPIFAVTRGAQGRLPKYANTQNSCLNTTNRQPESTSLSFDDPYTARGTPANIRIYLIVPETRAIVLHFAADNMGFRLLLFTQLSLKVELSDSHSVILGHSFCNQLQAGNGLLIGIAIIMLSKVSPEVATKLAKQSIRRQPHCRLMPLPRGTQANIRICL